MPPAKWDERADWRVAIHKVRSANALFWLQWDWRPDLAAGLLSIASPRARRAAYILDPWKHRIDRMGRMAVILRLDPCFVSYREAYEELSRRFPRGRFEWLPLGVDIDHFKPATGERDIFAYWMGRRHAPLHQALLSYCAKRGLEYHYSRTDVPPKRGVSADLASRARYFVVTPPDAEDPGRTGGFSPLVLRYFEGLSAGARLLGMLPRSGEYEHLLPPNAVLEVSPTGEDLAEKLDRDVAAGGAAQDVAKACELVRNHHSWGRRADVIHARLTAAEV